MKRLKVIGTSLTIAALLLCGWSIYELLTGTDNLVQVSLNLIYFFTLFIALFCVRVSLGAGGRMVWITYSLALMVILSSTYTWVNSLDFLIAGRYTIGLLPILLGTTMITSMQSKVKWSRYVEIAVGCMVLSLSVCVFTGAFGTSIYQLLFVGMIFITVVVLGLSFFAKTT